MADGPHSVEVTQLSSRLVENEDLVNVKIPLVNIEPQVTVETEEKREPILKKILVQNRPNKIEKAPYRGLSLASENSLMQTNNPNDVSPRQFHRIPVPKVNIIQKIIRKSLSQEEGLYV